MNLTGAGRDQAGGKESDTASGDAVDRANDVMTLSHHLNFRRIAALVAAAGTLFWIYTFHATYPSPGSDGGFHLIAILLLSAIFGIFFLPAWFLVAIGRLPKLATAWGLCGLIAFAVIWTDF